MAESGEELKSLLMRVKEENEKAGLKLNIQKIKIMASSLITSWQIEEGNVKQGQSFFPWGSRSLWMVTAVMKIRHLLLGRKGITNLVAVVQSPSRV